MAESLRVMAKSLRVSAPGKVVLWGEYAVLADAPAAVLAIDRRAICTIVHRESGYRLATVGFSSPTIDVPALQVDRVPSSAALFAHAGRALTRALPDGLDITLDTTDFHRFGEKLGIGSSAAAMVACYGAFCAVTGEELSLDRAIAAHQAFQGSGSGLDVAAAVVGGVIRFQSGQANALNFPDSVRFAFVFAGKGAGTGKQLGSFSDWRKHGDTTPLQRLADAACGIFESMTSKAPWAIYIEALRNLDTSAELGIYNEAHTELHLLSNSLGLLYKPCGAGGGDVGMAIGFDENEYALLQRFTQLSAARGFTPLNLTGTPHGLQVER